MKVLWTTNITLPTVAELVGLQKENKEGWLQSLARELIKCSDFHLAIMSFGNYSAPPQNIGYAVKLAINSWQV